MHFLFLSSVNDYNFCVLCWNQNQIQEYETKKIKANNNEIERMLCLHMLNKVLLLLFVMVCRNLVKPNQTITTFNVTNNDYNLRARFFISLLLIYRDPFKVFCTLSSASFLFTVKLRQNPYTKKQHMKRENSSDGKW